MLLLFLIRVAEYHLFGKSCCSFVYCACLSLAFVKFCVCASSTFGIDGKMWDAIVFIPDHCLSIFFPFY